jgi:hypothetical protein
MKKFLLWSVCACVALSVASVQAGLPPVGAPPVDQLSDGAGSPVLDREGGRAIANDFFDDFESYPLGEFCSGGGWEEWVGGGGTVCGIIVDDPAIDDQSLRINANDDMVQTFNIVGGIWELRTWVYVPSNATGRGFIIMLNQYPSPLNWSLDLAFDAGADALILFDDPTFRRSLIYNRWVETIVHIDLDVDLMQITYDGDQFIFDRSWREGASGGGEPWIQALDLFADTSNGTFYDNVSLKQLPDPVGACCDPESAVCEDSVNRADCPGRFKADTACGDLDPPCGQFNDECVRAVEIGADDSVTFDNRDATWTFNDFPMCFNGGDQAVRTMWYKFTATSNVTRVRTCPTPVDGGATDTLVSVFPTGGNGECLDFEPELGCSDDACGSPAGLHAEVCVPTTPGRVYDIMVASKPNTSGGLVTLETSSHDECPPPTQGACCLVGPSCFDQTSGDCFGLNGYYAGDDTRCADDPCPDCNPACDEGVSPEGEDCGDDLNGGCNADGNPEDFVAIEVGESFCGTIWGNSGTRDTDWYAVQVGEDDVPVTLELRVTGQSSTLSGWIQYVEGREGSGGCVTDVDITGNVSPAVTSPPGIEGVTQLEVTVPGVYWPYVRVSGNFNNYVPCCGTNTYELTLDVAGGGCVRNPAWQCDGDVDGDAQVNPVDSGLVQAAFGSVDEQDLCNYDMDCDGQINPVDSGIVQSLFGTCNAPRAECP